MRTAGCLFLMGMMFIYPQQTADAARRALRVFGLDIVPTLFPYMVLMRMLMSRMEKADKSACIAVSAFGWMGGSPSGASMISNIAETHVFTRRGLYTLCALTGTISPIFLANTVASWLNNSKIALFLLLSHFAGAIFTAIIVYVSSMKDTSMVDVSASPISASNQNAITASILPLLGVGGCLVFYSVLAEVVNTVLFHSSSLLSFFVHALLEISGGLKGLSQYLSGHEVCVGLMMSFSCGFSGISMLMQNGMFLKRLHVSLLQLIEIGILRACSSAAVMAFLLYVSSR